MQILLSQEVTIQHIIENVYDCGAAVKLFLQMPCHQNCLLQSVKNEQRIFKSFIKKLEDSDCAGAIPLAGHSLYLFFLVSIW